MLLKAVEVWDTLLSQILSEDSTPLTTARECILTFLLGSSMDFPWAPFVMPLLVEQTIKHLLILRQALLFLAVARGKWGHTLRLPRVGGAPGVGHIQGQLLPSGTPVLLLVLLVEGRPQGHTGGWAGDGSLCSRPGGDRQAPWSSALTPGPPAVVHFTYLWPQPERAGFEICRIIIVCPARGCVTNGALVEPRGMSVDTSGPGEGLLWLLRSMGGESLAVMEHPSTLCSPELTVQCLLPVP